MRTLPADEFSLAFAAMVSDVRWQEEVQYYPRYRSRYLAMLSQFTESAPDKELDILDVGGGQLAYLSMKLWGKDRICVADIADTCFDDLRKQGIDTIQWNLALTDAPTDRQFDVIFFSEVIEHLPVPGYIPLARLRSLLRPGGTLLCSTPNLYRLRNIFYMVSGRQIFDHFDLPGDRGYGHVLEYSAEHLEWQFRRAGFDDVEIRLCDFAHVPSRSLDRLLALFGAPLRHVPRYRDNLVAVARV
jgi:2-polyprenyl-3-methyl-5-hydroxy-6-metoxy-1,4-benzoquinol methylase